MKALVGYTGFVGSNIYAAGDFDAAYNSRNIADAFGTRPELLVYAGLRAEKYLANSAPERDLRLIEEAEENIERIGPEKLVLISTIDVFKTPVGVDENTVVDTDGLQPYGRNRYLFEQRVRELCPDALIVRLPALFGKNIKKNFIYDYIHRIPSALRADKLSELAEKEPLIGSCYEKRDDGFYRVCVPEAVREELKEAFRRAGFSALNFTDSRSVYQFYPLKNLWADICTALRHELRLLHPATEPLSAGELYRFLCGEDFVNELGGTPAFYDYRSVHAALYGGSGGYLYGREYILDEIRKFVEEAKA